MLLKDDLIVRIRDDEESKNIVIVIFREKSHFCRYPETRERNPMRRMARIQDLIR